MSPSRHPRLRQILVYAWTFPTSLWGLVFLPFIRLGGGGCQVVDGVLELYGGIARVFLRDWTLLPGGALAMTLGHVVLGLDRRALALAREHEHVHVRQAERWGPLFIPAYLGASIWLWMTRSDLHPYRDNPFEREAFGLTGP